MSGHVLISWAGFDRSLLNPVVPKTLNYDNPFPTFPVKKPTQEAPRENLNQAMSQMKIGDGRHAQQRMQASPPRGQPVQGQGRGPPMPAPNGRQDSGNFEGQKYNQRPPANRAPSGRGPPPMNGDGARGPPMRRPSDPAQRSFGPNTQRSATMPQNMSGGGQGRGYESQEQWAEPGAAPGYYDVSSPTYAPPRPSTAGGTRQNVPPGQPQQRPPVPQMPPPQMIPQYRAPQQQQQQQAPPADEIDTFYDDYYGETTDRKSVTSNIDMPNFDAIPEANTKHRRGDSIDHHLSPDASTHDLSQMGSMANAQPQQFRQQVLRSRSQPDLNGQYVNGIHEMAADTPPVPGLPRANTGFDGHNGLPSGPRGRGQSNRGMTPGGMQRPPPQPYSQGQPPNDPRYPRQPPGMQRVYSDESAYSEPPMHSMRNVSSPIGPGTPIQRPGTAAPVPGRLLSDPLARRPGTTQPMSNPDALPAHPAPVRAGLMQQGRQQQAPPPVQPPQSARPPPVRQHNSDTARPSYESQPAEVKRQSVPAHPVTHDELNRLRNTWKANPADSATGLLLAKKLVEAASILSDEGGTADTRTRNKNKEKYIMESHKTLKKLVSGGHPDSMFYMADCYGQGLLGLQVDTKEAFSLYQSAAKAGHAASAYRTAVCCEMGHEEGGGTKRDPLKAVQWYRRAAVLGDTPALYKMGMILLKGLLGQQRNFGEAINMLKRAAERADKDNPHALHELGLIYEASEGNQRIIQDEAYALQLFHQAADLNYKFSQFRLGQAYEYGLLGCPIDARTSIAWYTRAAAQEEHQSELALSGWYLTGTSGILEQSDTEAYLWARKAACAEPPLPKALFAMGYFTEVGIGCPRSLEEAKRWYGRAACKFIHVDKLSKHKTKILISLQIPQSARTP
jgi:TPR repeat protein